jgi:tryptophanase
LFIFDSVEGLNIQKQYDTARAFIGDLGEDLVHHCFIKIATKNLGVIDHPDAYFQTVMFNELRKDSKFRRIYNPKVEDFEINYSFLEDYDPDKVKAILTDLEKEGHKEEIKVFRYIATHQNKNCGLERSTGVRREILKSIYELVKQEIVERYGDSDN